jgi:hypothetical protein
MRRQIDLHREEMPKVFCASIMNQLDEVSLTMIERVNECEAAFLASLNEQMNFTLETTHDQELKELNETFRDPNISMDTIKQIQSKQGERMTKLKSLVVKSNETFLLNENEFKPCFSADNEAFFGILNLHELAFSPLKSKLLTERQAIDLLKLCEFNLGDKWSLLYRGSRDGFGSRDFHLKCDGKASTLTICKALKSGFIFGGYTQAKWESPLPSSKHRFVTDPNAFLFSLTNRDNEPCKMKTNRASHSICCRLDCGPQFGLDLVISGESNFILNRSYLGDRYSHPKYAARTEEAKAFLAGSYTFLLSEIEVYSKSV